MMWIPFSELEMHGHRMRLRLNGIKRKLKKELMPYAEWCADRPWFIAGLGAILITIAASEVLYLL